MVLIHGHPCMHPRLVCTRCCCICRLIMHYWLYCRWYSCRLDPIVQGGHGAGELLLGTRWPTGDLCRWVLLLLWLLLQGPCMQQFWILLLWVYGLQQLALLLG